MKRERYAMTYLLLVTNASSAKVWALTSGGVPCDCWVLLLIKAHERNIVDIDKMIC